MRPFLLAVVALALIASPASAAVIEIEEHFCGCDPSSGDEDTRGLVVRAAPGELNRMSIRVVRRGVVIDDLGAPLTGACRPASSGGRFCRGEYDSAEVQLGDGDDRIDLRDLGGTVDGGLGDDDIVVAGSQYLLVGGPGADLLDALMAPGSGVSYFDHTEGVTVRLNGLVDDGAPGEGDDLRGVFTGIVGGSGDDVLEAGPTASGISGAGGDDTIVGSPERDTLQGGDGDDDLAAGGGNDSVTGGEGADRLSGGPGRDEARYDRAALPLHLSIGDGPGDGAAGENDDLLGDVEDLLGGDGPDVIVGDADANRLVGWGGRDILFGGEGADFLDGGDDGDRLDAGPGPDRVFAGPDDLPLLDDGERDRTNCHSTAPIIEADLFDLFARCAPLVSLDRVSGPGVRGVVRVLVQCDYRSAVPCAGTLQLQILGKARSRAVRFGPIRPRRRELVRLRMRGAPLVPNTCLHGLAVTTRRDIRSSTRSDDFVRCRV